MTCPVALSMAGYNYSCKQITSLEAQCRPATEQEMKEFAIEFVAMNAAAVAMPFAIGGAATTVLPAMMANPAIVSGAFRIVRIGNSVYSINNAAKECQGFDSMTNDEKTKCVLAAGYAVTATVDGGLAGAGFFSTGSQLLTGVEIGNDVANLALGGVNAYNRCEGGTNSECYWALISSGIDLVALGVDVNQAKQWSKANLKVEVEDIPETIKPENESTLKFNVRQEIYKTNNYMASVQPAEITQLDSHTITIKLGNNQFLMIDLNDPVVNSNLNEVQKLLDGVEESKYKGIVNEYLRQFTDPSAIKGDYIEYDLRMANAALNNQPISLGESMKNNQMVCLEKACFSALALEKAGYSGGVVLDFFNGQSIGHAELSALWSDPFVRLDQQKYLFPPETIELIQRINLFGK